MDAISDQQHERLEEARRVLRSWSPSRKVPEIIASGLSVLHGGLPSGVYCVSDRGRGDLAVGALSGMLIDRLLDTPFMRTDQLFSRTFADVSEEESVWGAENRPVMGDDLRRDSYRWRAFQRTLMAELGYRDNLRIFFASKDAWLGWCGSFAIGSQVFTESDRALLSLFAEDLQRVLLAWHELAPAFGTAHSMVQVAMGWPSPVFAYTCAGQFLFANDAARLTHVRMPEWLDEALADNSRAVEGWDRMFLPYAGGSILLFWRRSSDGPQICLFDANVVARLELPPHLQRIALLVMQGCSNKEIARLTRLSPVTVKRYLEKLRKRTGGAKSRGEFAYQARRDSFAAYDLWPVKFQRTRASG
ncbi:sigma factor-like helix-turn-helix DNA-binding protein [Nannocystis pusilla]|uniref:HTH luxR-type domain-containing protein n=1 Tax=Nannocystis pusilla TaxID=889268 RepID=A0ABS7TVI7_9BACT|nr:sigma factor-like helix-turn-helix DNA-binding protein [Nannocystis pusilla]MBZ5712259.1 hypothetical protein [Nannocystis pusilla]